MSENTSATQKLNQVPAEASPSAMTEAFQALNAVSSEVDAEIANDALPNQTVPLGDSVQAKPGPLATNSGDEGEPSIEEYMQQLLARSNGYSGNATAPMSAAPPAAPAEKPAKKAAEATTQEPQQRVQKPAPERRDDLSNMREIANLSARRALGKYSGQQLLTQMRTKLVLASLMLVASFFLSIYATSIQTFAFAASTVALLSAATWTMQYYTLSGRLSEICRLELESNREKTTDEMADVVAVDGHEVPA